MNVGDKFLDGKVTDVEVIEVRQTQDGVSYEVVATLDFGGERRPIILPQMSEGELRKFIPAGNHERRWFR